MQKGKITAASVARLLGIATAVMACSTADAATNIALWSMDYAGQANPAVLDSRQGPGQGLANGNNLSYGATNDVLLCFNGFANLFTTTADVPPLGMFVNGAGPGSAAYDASAIANVDGALFFAQDVSGNEFSFTNSFSIEMFFKSAYGDQSQAGTMYLLRQGEGNFRYSITLNESAPGGLRFTFRTASATNDVDLTAENFANGEWYYLLATYAAASGQAQITVANQAGTTNWSASGTVVLSGPANDGNLLLGRNTYPVTADPCTFIGYMDEVQISSGVVSAAERIGRIPSIDGPAPVFVKPSILSEPAPQTVVTGGFAGFAATASGSPPLAYQWRRNGIELNGETNSSINVFPCTGTAAGDYDVVVRNFSNAVPFSVTSTVAPLVLMAPYAIAEWPMDASGGNFPAVLDARTASGQGTVAGADAGAGLVSDHLLTFNAFGNTYYTSTNCPPATMFINGNGGGPVSYDAAVISGVDGALFYPADLYGNEFLFRGPFSIELFFRTDGDQSSSGVMQLILQAEDSYRFGVTLNESASGGLQFSVDNGGGAQTAVLTSANYADGSWHYLLAVYDSIANQLRLTVVKQDGTEASTTTSLPAGFGPLFASPSGNHNLHIGRNTYNALIDPRSFIGLIDEVQISAGAVTSTTRVGRIPSLDGALPSSVAPFFMTQTLASRTIVDGAGAWFSVKAQGSEPLNYQWRHNGNAIPGATASSLALFPASLTNSGTYDVVVNNGAGSTNSIPATLTVLPPVSLAHWRMDPTGSNFPCTLDINTAPGQGFFTNNPTVDSAQDHLAIWNDLPPVHEYRTSNSVPPQAMFLNGHSGGSFSYDAANIAAEPGALIFLQDTYGNEFSFEGAFSIEMFFKTHGDQSTNGLMELIKQGEGFFRYGVILNESTNGAVRFAINNGRSIQVVDAGNASLGKNYADGAWHYLLAQYDTHAGEIRLTLVNEDGSEETAQTPVPADYGPLPSGNDGNMFIGRDTFNLDSPRTFIGLIDEIQVTAGLVPGRARLGLIPSLDIRITRLGFADGNAEIDFTAGLNDTPAAFALQGSDVVTGTYEDAAAVITQLAPGSFRATLPANNPAGFFRIRRN